MNRNLKFLLYALRGSAFKTLHCSLLTQTANVAIHPNVWFRAARSASILGEGILCVGKKWGNGRYFPSEFILCKDAKLVVKGTFSIFTGCQIGISKGATLVLGDSGYISNNASINCFESITLGDRVFISKGVTLRDHDGHRLNDNQMIGAPIVIEDNVWIGLNATILKGVRIGSGAVVAAGAVVTRDVPPKTLVGGVPARVIREDVTWS